jgi:predicted TIM-barrel fold metal-dependent hydrolase
MTIVHVEGDSGWLPYWLQRMEDHWDLVENAEHEYLTMRPTEYFRRNFYVAARGDERTLRATIELTGDDNLMVSTDYPHGDGSWPEGLDALDRQGLAQDTREKLLGKNAARAFRLEDDLAGRLDVPKQRGWWRRLRAGAPIRTASV